MRKITKIFLILTMCVLLLTGCTKNVDLAVDTPKPAPEASTKQEFSYEPPFDGYKLIEVEGGNLSGKRQAKVVVDIGYGDREYYAFTNEYGQLVRVIAKTVKLQDPKTEKLTSEGRYYPDEAKVPGVERTDLDEGHVLADSLGGVSNAYNITPQNSTLNRHGDQAYMEESIRKAGGCTNFEAIITYPDTKTQIPSHYNYTYTLKGNVIKESFDNKDSDQANKDLNSNSQTEKPSAAPAPTPNTKPSENSSIQISKLDKVAEYIILQNTSSKAVDITGWKIVSVKGEQSFTIPKYSLPANSTLKIGDKTKNSDVKFDWHEGSGIWNNSSSDPAELYDTNGNLVARLDN